MRNSRQNIQVAVRLATLDAADQLHELVRALGSGVTKSMLDSVISIATLKRGYSFENKKAEENFHCAVIKNLKKDFPKDFNKVYSDINERVLL